MADLFSCPVCQSVLMREERRFCCSNRHSFDIAKEGYVNLLLANQTRSSNPGDSREMLQARRRFLSAGYYDPLAEALAESIESISGALPDNCITGLDAGCGEGFFLKTLKKSLLKSNIGRNVEFYGTDISKIAIKMAAKADSTIQFAVAGSFKLPIISNSLDVVLRMFAPGDDSEIVRCLKPTGILVTVTPGPRHLWALKEKIYQKADLHNDEIKTVEGLRVVDSKRLHWQIDVDNQDDLHDLLTMTPFYWNGDSAVKEQLKAMNSLKTDVDFMINIYQK